MDVEFPLKDIPLSHEFLCPTNRMAELYPNFAQGLTTLFSLNREGYSDFLTFKGEFNPVTGGLWLSDTAHHHLAVAVFSLLLAICIALTGI